MIAKKCVFVVEFDYELGTMTPCLQDAQGATRVIALESNDVTLHFQVELCSFHAISCSFQSGDVAQG